MSQAQAIKRDPGEERTDRRPRPRRETRSATTRYRLLADRAATWIVTGGGLAIIASILGILLFILAELLPLFNGATVEVGGEFALEAPTGGLIGDEHRTHVASLTPDGRVSVRNLALDETVRDVALPRGADGGTRLVATGAAPGQQLLIGAADDGRVFAVPLRWDVFFDEDVRRVEPKVLPPVTFAFETGSNPVGPFTARIDDEGGATAVAEVGDGSLMLLRRDVDENLFTEEITERWTEHRFEAPVGLTELLLDRDGLNLFAGTSEGELVWWSISGNQTSPPQTLTTNGSPITALTLLIGDRSVVTGQADGSLGIWFRVRQDDESFVLTKIREFPPQPGPIRLLTPSLRDKGFLAQDELGSLGLYYSTSRRVLWTGASPLPGATALYYSPKADCAFLAHGSRLARLNIHNRHPEVGWTALFGKVWYEGYDEPAHVWQSTGGSDDFEPKLSLTPLMIGTLKGTVYSLFLAIPLGVLGAMYTSQFMHPRLRRYVKPSVEIMAALPSVVLGFLAGLWLAPRVEQVIPALVLMLVVLPLMVLAAGYAWRTLPRSFRNRFFDGTESLLSMVVVALGIWFCLSVNFQAEALIFGGDFRAWLLGATGLQYDQRNAVVVGLAMGFAVIPMIFSISEDAFSNVPRNLTSGSLALGASRWQTVTRVVLPTAGPGIFSAIMIGFGRAVGETMIVLMATGNTPIMDWNPFNGFRTLSANIAVEIPEAPQGATLYRALFLAALILFMFTFLINTLAEVVRQRLRKRYAEL